MKGTEKQIKWAEAIREVVKENWEEALKPALKTKISEMEEAGKKTEQWKETLNYFEQITENKNAEFWIDNFAHVVEPKRLENDKNNILKIEQMEQATIEYERLAKEELKRRKETDEAKMSGIAAQYIRREGGKHLK